jgi:hypothetical protein
MKRRFEVSAIVAWKLVFQVDGIDDFDAKVQASALLSEVRRYSPCPIAASVQIVSYPSMDKYDVSEVPLSIEETKRREHLDELAGQFHGPVFKYGDRWCKWKYGEGSTFLDLESGEEFIHFDGGTGTMQEYDAWRESEIARSHAQVTKMSEQSKQTKPKRW